MARGRLVSRLLYLAERLRRGPPRAPQPETAPDVPASTDPPDRPEGTVLWMHAPEAQDAAPLLALTQEVSRLRGEPVHGLLTYSGGTPPAILAEAVISLPAPSDTSTAVARFLDHCKPDVGLVLGLPDRPQMLTMARREGVPLFLAAPRRGMAERRLPLLPASLIDLFDTCLAPSGSDARLLRARVSDPDRIVTTGPLTDTGIALPCDEAELSRVAAQLSARPAWLALRPDSGELIAIEDAHRIAARSAHRLLLILSLDDTHTAETAAQLFEDAGWRTARRSRGETPAPEIQVYIADGDDEASSQELWFRLAPIVFIGGTLSDNRPADPFAPAAHGAAIIHGPRTGSEPRRFETLRKGNATLLIDAPEALGPSVTRLLSPDLAAQLALAGWSVVSEGAHVIDRMARMIDEALDRREEQK